IPSATKNSVTKKSLMLTALAITSRLYGKVERLMPAISAPISGDSPMKLATPDRKKHHASPLTRASSGALATERKRKGSTYFERARLPTTISAPFHNEKARGSRSGLVRF